MVSSKNFTILMYAAQTFMKPVIQHFRKNKCPSMPSCFITENISDMQKSHAVIFGDVNLPGKYGTTESKKSALDIQLHGNGSFYAKTA